MRLRIVTTVLIDLDTGQTQTKATYAVEGAEAGLGNSLALAAAALMRQTPPPSDEPYPDPSDSERVNPSAKEARILGGLLEIREDVEQALAQRSPERVLEVLKWIRSRRSSEKFRSIPSLFWSLVRKD